MKRRRSTMQATLVPPLLLAEGPVMLPEGLAKAGDLYRGVTQDEIDVDVVKVRVGVLLLTVTPGTGEVLIDVSVAKGKALKGGVTVEPRPAGLKMRVPV